MQERAVAEGDGEIAQLAAAIARQDRGALRRLYDLQAPTMLGVALRIVRRRDLAEEVVQDAFVRIWRQAGSFDPARGSARGWLFAIVRNRALNMVRDGSRELGVADETLAGLAEARSDGPDTVLADLANGSALRRCLERLEPQRRRSILLAYVEGLTHGEIAGRLGVPLGTAKAWVRRALLSLKECMA